MKGPSGISSKIFVKYQKAGQWLLILCMGVIAARVTFTLLFEDVTAAG